MDWALLRRNSAIRMLPRTGLIVLGMASLVTMLRLGFIESGKLGASDDGVVELAVALAVLWFPVAAFLLYTGAFKRCTRLDLALPFPARKLWSHNLAGVVMTASLMVAITGGMMGIQEVGIRNWLLGHWDTPGLNVFKLLPQVFGIAGLSAALLQSFRPARFSIGFDRRRVRGARRLFFRRRGAGGLSRIFRSSLSWDSFSPDCRMRFFPRSTRDSPISRSSGTCSSRSSPT